MHAVPVDQPDEEIQHHTSTRDSHWREAGASGPYRPFPDKPYFRPLVEIFQMEQVVFIEKSRDLMLSWLCVGYFTHAAMTNDRREVLFQSQKEDKAGELVDYAKTLYEQQDPGLKQRFPLAKPLRDQAALKLEFANGSRIVGIPEGADQIRSFHPWGLLMDEAAFQPEAGEAYDAAVPVCQKIIVVSSAGPGWFADFVTEAI
jgi:phage FluMu gp28-like protein